MKNLILFIFLASIFCQAQTTSTTATPLYPDGNNFAGGTVQAVFTPPTGIIDQNLYLLNGSPFPYYVNGTINGSGQFTFTLTDDHIVRPLGGRWMFTICSPASVPCTTSLQDVFGASIDLTTLINNDVAPISGVPSYFPIFFQDSEIHNNVNGGTEYFDYVSKTFRCWNGSSWSNCGGGGGGGGSVVQVTAGNFDPVFTTTVTNNTTTPNISFIAENVVAHTVYANETGGSAIPSFQTDALTINTSSPLTGGSLVHLGGVITIACPTCSVPQVSVTASSPIVVTPSPGVSTFVISCPTCGTNTGTVSNFTSGNLSPLFTTSVANPTTAPALSFLLSNAASNTVYANLTGGSTLPSFSTTSIAQAIPTGFTSSGSPILNLNGTLTWGMPTSWTTGDILLGNGANSVSRLAIGANTTVLTSNGTTASWQAATGGGGGANKVSFDSCSPGQVLNNGGGYWRQDYLNYGSGGLSKAEPGFWIFKNGVTGDVICMWRVTSNISGTQTVIINLSSDTTTTGQTDTFNICDATSASRNINAVSFVCSGTQNFTTTSTSGSDTQLTFSLSSTPVIDQYLLVDIQHTNGTVTSEIRMAPPKVALGF